MSDDLSLNPGGDYIFASDTMAALGLKDILDKANRSVAFKIINIKPLSKDIENIDETSCSRLIIYLPRDISDLFFLLKTTANYLMQSKNPEEIIVITPYSFNRLYHTLRSLLSPALLRKVSAIDAAVSLQDIACRLAVASPEEDCLPIQARREEIATGELMVGLTRSEYDCVLDFFCGRSIKEPFYSPKSSAVSTRYSQRNSGLRKLVAQLPDIAADIRQKRVELSH